LTARVRGVLGPLAGFLTRWSDTPADLAPLVSPFLSTVSGLWSMLPSLTIGRMRLVGSWTRRCFADVAPRSTVVPMDPVGVGASQR
jgi:hypothetical protein